MSEQLTAILRTLVEAFERGDILFRHVEVLDGGFVAAYKAVKDAKQLLGYELSDEEREWMDAPMEPPQ